MDYSNLKVPNHVAIILDGNGRWAKERGLTRSMGHDAGFTNLKNISKYILSKGIKVLSVYAFSTENFKRSKDEVDYLMNIFTSKFKSCIKDFNKENIKVIFSGRDKPLPNKVLKAMKELGEATKDNTKGILNICINYGGRSELVDTCKKIGKMVENKEISIDDIDEELVSRNLYNDLPDVDLMIRTSGELRLSNFMLWQNSYAEFYFPKTYFPDFDEEEFDKAIIEYTKRDRRFGNIDYTK
mgnify:FL=1